MFAAMQYSYASLKTAQLSMLFVLQWGTEGGGKKTGLEWKGNQTVVERDRQREDCTPNARHEPRGSETPQRSTPRCVARLRKENSPLLPSYAFYLPGRTLVCLVVWLFCFFALSHSLTYFFIYLFVLFLCCHPAAWFERLISRVPRCRSSVGEAINKGWHMAPAARFYCSGPAIPRVPPALVTVGDARWWQESQRVSACTFEYNEAIRVLECLNKIYEFFWRHLMKLHGHTSWIVWDPTCLTVRTSQQCSVCI